MEIRVALKIFSTLAIIVPLAFSLRILPTAGLLGRLFFAFLCCGFVADLTMWYLAYHPYPGLAVKVFNFYSLLEALFFFWLIHRVAEPTTIKRTSKLALYLVFPFWLFGFFVIPLFIEGEAARSIPFETTYNVTAAFLSAFTILSMIELKSNLMANGRFWFMLAIFFYTFSTFFLGTFLGSRMLAALWPLSNITNITTYIFYSFGFYVFRREAATD